MKLYRVQARYKNMYYNGMLEAKNDKAALDTFANGVEAGEIKGNEESFYSSERPVITFEEVDRNVSTRTSGEKTSAGIQVGNTSVVSGQSNS